ncbi:MAG: hypothetical protein WCK35_19265 [Chloroflexota bacterium]
MKINFIQIKFKKISSLIQNWRNKRSEYKLAKLKNKQELFVRILQKRYGYSNAKAAIEMNKHYSEIILT